MNPRPKSFRDILSIPPSSASTQDSTLIIIDAQNEYATGALQVKNIAYSRRAIADLLARYRRAGNGNNIVHVVHKVPDGAPVFTPGTALEQELDELTPAMGEKVVVKQFPSAFAQTDLHAYLGGLGGIGQKLVLVGYMAHVCVSTTTRAASELGYDVLVVRDAVGDRHIPGVDAETLRGVVLNELADAFATVIDAGDILG
ncbi:Isochorismatase-like protein [Aspergillus cavernicola]|uniref:Isochorismatase-like protein n=1 Tax=Aspergillus cavernicola TaxID=176166 RepID=A0ABR4HPJ6_9EURO